jgi:hypothetical protein
LSADDTVIFAESEKDWQNALNTFKWYCDQWKLKINVDKTKVLIFSKGNIRRNLKFILAIAK